MIENTEGHTPL